MALAARYDALIAVVLGLRSA
ncbi:hypothetical protein [Nitrosovibrio tenuis]